MYIGKHRTPKKESQDADPPRASLHIPENYAGNAFSASNKEEMMESIPETEEEHEKEIKYLPTCLDTHSERTSFLPKLDRLFSGDTLLILLAILLAGNEDSGELAVILLLLLLF